MIDFGVYEEGKLLYLLARTECNTSQAEFIAAMIDKIYQPLEKSISPGIIRRRQND